MQALPSPACPRCQSQSSQPDRLAYEDSAEARVVMRCDSCRHRWSAVVPIDAAWPDLRQRLLRQSVWRQEP